MKLALALATVLGMCLDAAQIPRATSRDAPAGDAATADDDCQADDDCVLLPWITCCGECVPAPPFEAAPRWVLDGILIESETHCAHDDRPCDLVCDPVPAGCVARAQCRDGRCVVAADGCGAPTS